MYCVTVLLGWLLYYLSRWSIDLSHVYIIPSSKGSVINVLFRFFFPGIEDENSRVKWLPPGHIFFVLPHPLQRKLLLTLCTHAIISTIFTWLNAMAPITLVSKIGAATIQSRPPFNTGKWFLSQYFHNRLWAPLSSVTNQGAVSNQINKVCLSSASTVEQVP